MVASPVTTPSAGSASASAWRAGHPPQRSLVDEHGDPLTGEQLALLALAAW